MIQKHQIQIIRYLLLTLILLLPAGCDKDEEPMIYAPTLVTNNATGLTRYDAVLTGSAIENPKSVGKCKIGFLYAESSSMNNAKEVEARAGDKNQYTVALEGLSIGKTYYYCIYASTGYSRIKGNVISFSTLASEAPTLNAPVAESKSETGAILTSGVTDDGGSDLTDFGVVYKVKTEEDNADPTEYDIVKNASSGFTSEAFTVELTNLKANTTYLIRSYAKNKTGKTGYSAESIEITTDALKVPTVTCNPVGDISAYTALVTARAVTPDAAYPILKRGFCWSAENQVPTIDNLNEEVALGAADFSKLLEGLNTDTKYYLRAYAENDKGIGYSPVVEFTTQKLQVVGFETVPQISNITVSSAEVTAVITVPEGTEILEKGICYDIFSTKPGVDMEGGPKKDTSNGNNIHIAINGLQEGTNYYVTAYARTVDGYFYSNPTSFHTVQTHVPTLAVPVINNIGETVATVKVEVTTDGGRDIEEIGFCWSSEMAAPNINDNDHITETGKLETYTGQISNLKKGVKYYVRAYAKNVNGTAYSPVTEFTTQLNSAPEVEDLTMSIINDDNVTVQATITNTGGLSILRKGFVWSDSSNATPTLENCLNKKELDTGSDASGRFETQITDLTMATPYYICAYAENEKGITYSIPVRFVTIATYAPAVGYPSAENVTANTADMSASISNDGGASVTEVGFCWSENSSEPVIDEAKKNYTKAQVATNFSTKISGLKAATYYYVRAYAKNKNGISYSSGYSSFTTLTTTPGPDDNPLPEPQSAPKARTVRK